MAKTKQGGSTSLGRDSVSKRLGVKLFDGQIANAGAVIIRQRGTKYMAGVNVRRGEDDTLYAVRAGRIRFEKKWRKRFDNKSRQVSFVSIIPE
ncbi:MAG: 50S ribosomal protein L27 [Parcubacteria group bacterium]|nr:50S ribosomal protein L27 [Parcubacteria group bacterium]